ncbi:MAG: hypothetical protein K0S08_159 [Gammaproteobacteria bacterium]|jgi:hypothetical protein|nr:hypothetical protein [Gammaproteobacteria bacterium]
MSNLLNRFLIGFSAFLSVSIASADFHLGPLTSDDNSQQALQQQYYNPQTDQTDFSFPSGVFRQVSDGCLYDMNKLSCYSQDINGMTSYFPTVMTVGDCQNIYVNRGGFLKCGD